MVIDRGTAVDSFASDDADARGQLPGALSELWVCLERPPTRPPRHAIVLSFTAPSVEAAMEEEWGSQVVSGRTLIQQIRSQARAQYVQLIARIGSTPCANGRTLRQILRGSATFSRWWFLDVTEKDCLSDEDTIYATILRLTAVQTLQERYGIERVHVHGVGSDVTAAIGRGGGRARASIRDLATAIVVGLLGRVALVMEHLRLWWTWRALPAQPPGRRDVLLQGYWDWTVGPDVDGGLQDRYFRDLPAQLARYGLSVGWLASFEPSVQPWQQGRGQREVAQAASRHAEVVLLERHLSPRDVVRTSLDLRDPIQTTRFVLDRRFRDLCMIGRFDLSTLLRRRLLRSVWGATLCRLQCVALATSRVCRQLDVRIIVTCFELFLRSRAVYAGAREGSASVRVWAAQHAGYSSDKTLGVFEPEIELRGIPDGCAIPAPDGIFVLGDLSRRIWKANGFSSEQLPLTGGLRFQAVRVASRPRRSSIGISILVAGGGNEAAHLDLCDAVIAAASGLPSVRILWRDHPYCLLSVRPAFRRYREALVVTSGTLDEDLAAADLVLFTQAGLAEEALLCGIPTWQWVWPGFNASPFLDVPVIPSFTSVRALRRELEAFLRDPTMYEPSTDTQRRVLWECFGPEPAAASECIAGAIHQMIHAQEDIGAERTESRA